MSPKNHWPVDSMGQSRYENRGRVGAEVSGKECGWRHMRVPG